MNKHLASRARCDRYKKEETEREILIDPEHGDSTFLRNIGKPLPHYIMSHPFISFSLQRDNMKANRNREIPLQVGRPVSRTTAIVRNSA
jgi:hypothetical protein